jgi:dihydroxyacetone kinase DhaKLM complex PTS-EIIA-like component DhaM
MRIKIKLHLENTTGKEELAKYLIDCLAQKAIGENIEVTSVEDHADVIVDMGGCNTKEDVVFNLEPIVSEIAGQVFSKIPRFQKGQKKIRKKLHGK